MDKLLDKLCSHRARGYSALEQSPSAFMAACRSSVPAIEIDLRVSRDGVLFVCHDPVIPGTGAGRPRIADSASESLKSLVFENGETLLTLERALDIFKDHAFPGRGLCLDVKDAGSEERILTSVDARGLNGHVTFVSWIPGVLWRFHALGSDCPLVLSHVNLMRHGVPGRMLETALAPFLIVSGRTVVIGRFRMRTSTGRYGRGYEHACYISTPGRRTARMLSSYGGGLCVHVSRACDRLVQYCLGSGLALWVYGVRGVEGFTAWASRPGVGMVLSDDAPSVLAVHEMN